MNIAPVKDVMWKALRHYATDDDLGCLRRLLPPALVPAQSRVDELLAELTQSRELLDAVNSPQSLLFDGHASAGAPQQRLDTQIDLAGAGRGRAVMLYVTARIIKPRVIMETGCFTGWDSALLLQALHRSGEGQLYSIDLPARDGQFSQRGRRAGLPTGLSPGFLVPDAFRDRWTLIEGNVRAELMPLLARVGDVDLFLHDSDHTYPHMMWEYAAIAPHLRRDGGIIVSDDIAWNTAFWDFASAVGRRCVIHRSNPNVGAIAIDGGRQR